MTTRILITGSRAWTDDDLLFETLSNIYEELEDDEVVIVHGGAGGADALAGRWARMMQEDFRVFEERHPANWQPAHLDGATDYNAGFARNDQMIELGADLCVAFYQKGAKNHGTMHCRSHAEAAGIPVKEVWSA